MKQLNNDQLKAQEVQRRTRMVILRWELVVEIVGEAEMMVAVVEDGDFFLSGAGRATSMVSQFSLRFS